MENYISMYEKLGLFYLGKIVDQKTSEITENLFLYKSKDLTTHAAIIGMTGSGKTGLGISIIEEAAIDKIPSIIIDPKGDMGNLLLAFPELKPEDFAGWIDPSEASNKGVDTAVYARQTAENWEKGIRSFYQDKDRISLYRDSVDLSIYTPGSSAGMPLSVLSSFDVPSPEIMNDPDTFSSIINSTAMGILSLVGIKADALTSREYILLAAIFSYCWKKGRDLSLEELIGYITHPPFEKIGVLSVNQFYPQNERFELAVLLNNILSSPGFSMWLEGERLDINNLLYTKDGKPRVTILSIAHLDNTQRMFFVTLFLNKFISWMRQQKGTPSLRSLLYMDEIFGFFPATSSPPSKKPMLLLLKQARAYGIGIVLSTQNPIDLDYKGLSNIGSWFLGRLQTRQDRDRVINGLIKSSEDAMDKGEIESLLANMGKRHFLLKSAHLDSLQLLHTRWVLSYLRGPLTSTEIKKLMEDRKKDSPSRIKDDNALTKPDGKTPGTTDIIPLISDKIKQYFLNNPPFSENSIYEPGIIIQGEVRFYNQSRNIDQKESVSLKLPINRDTTDIVFEDALLNTDDFDLYDTKPFAGAKFALLPSIIEKMDSMNTVEKQFADFLYDTRRIELYSCRDLKLISRPGEKLSDFKTVMMDSIREKKDSAIEKLAEKFEKKEKRLEDKYSKLLEKLEKEEADVKASKTQSLLSFGSSILGALLGRTKVGTLSSGVTGLNKASRVLRQKKDVDLVKKRIEECQEDIQRLEEELKEKIEEISEQYDIDRYEIETVSIKPRKTDIFGISAQLLWESR